MARDKQQPRLSRTEQRQRERRAQQRRNRIVVTAIAVVALVVLAAVVILVSNTPAEAPIPETVSRYDEFKQTMTDDGFARLGSLDAVRVVLISSFGCEPCRTFHDTVLPALLERVQADDISLLYAPVVAGSVPNTIGAMRSAVCAGQQGELYPYGEALFSWMEQFGTDAFRDNRLTTGAQNLGLDMDRFRDCRGSGLAQSAFEAAGRVAGGRNASITPPAVFVNGVLVESTELTAINAAIDSALEFRSGGAIDGDLTAPTAEPETEVTAEPTVDATDVPTDVPTVEPTEESPTDSPTIEPTTTDG